MAKIPAEEFRRIFKQYGFDTDRDLARAVQKSASGRERSEVTIYTGINKFLNRGIPPSVPIVEGLRETCGYNPALDKLFAQYGIEVEPHKKPMQRAAANRERGAAKELRSKAAHLEELLHQIGPARDAAFEEVMRNLGTAYKSGTPGDKSRLYKGVSQAYSAYVAQGKKR